MVKSLSLSLHNFPTPLHRIKILDILNELISWFRLNVNLKLF